MVNRTLIVKRHKINKRMQEFNSLLSEKYGKFGSTRIVLENETHLADRFLDRAFPQDEYQRILTYTMKWQSIKLLCLLGDPETFRINLKGKDGFQIGATFSRHIDRVGVRYVLKLRTMYKNDRPDELRKGGFASLQTFNPLENI